MASSVRTFRERTRASRSPGMTPQDSKSSGIRYDAGLKELRQKRCSADSRPAVETSCGHRANV